MHNRLKIVFSTLMIVEVYGFQFFTNGKVGQTLVYSAPLHQFPYKKRASSHLMCPISL